MSVPAEGCDAGPVIRLEAIDRLESPLLYMRRLSHRLRFFLLYEPGMQIYSSFPGDRRRHKSPAAGYRRATTRLYPRDLIPRLYRD